VARLRTMPRPLIALLLLLTSTAACESGDHDGHEHHHQGSGAVCPTTQTLSYESFGRAFFSDYCLRCHSRSKSGTERMAAPTALNYDLLADIRAAATDIDEHAAAGPKATNTAMPNNDPRPSLQERQRLGEWLACGAP
jgi:uncharacterized membrane protein